MAWNYKDGAKMRQAWNMKGELSYRIIVFKAGSKWNGSLQRQSKEGLHDVARADNCETAEKACQRLEEFFNWQVSFCQEHGPRKVNSSKWDTSDWVLGTPRG